MPKDVKTSSNDDGSRGDRKLRLCYCRRYHVYNPKTGRIAEHTESWEVSAMDGIMQVT